MLRRFQEPGWWPLLYYLGSTHADNFSIDSPFGSDIDYLPARIGSACLGRRSPVGSWQWRTEGPEGRVLLPIGLSSSEQT